MTSKGSGRSHKQGWSKTHLTNEVKKAAIHKLDMRSALELYGVKFDQKGAAHCPFHNEKTPSFRVKADYWHCFGCGEGGDLIKFVRKLHGLSYPETLEMICEDFGIVASDPTREDRKHIDQQHAEREKAVRRYQELLDARDLCMDIYLHAYDVLEYAIRFCGGKSLENERYVNAQFNLLVAEKALSCIEFECAHFFKQNPFVAYKANLKGWEHAETVLPPAPRWKGAEESLEYEQKGGERHD